MKSAQKSVFQTCWMVLGLLSLASGILAEFPDIHEDVNSNHGFCETGNDITNRCSSSAKQGLKEGNNLDVYDLLWEKNLDVSKQTLELPFLQHMQFGDLQADVYMNFMIQDIYYLDQVRNMLEKMHKKQDMTDDLKQFMKGRYESYNKSRSENLKNFNLDNPSVIKPIPAMEKYLSDYKNIMENEKPIFFAVSLLPCSRLWPWIANQLKMTYCNAYFTWKKNNMRRYPEKHYKALLNKYLETPEEIKRANEIFRQQMQNEHDFFAASLEE